MTKPTVKAVNNIWGNWICFIGAKKVTTFGEEFDARQWLREMMESGEYILSAKSDIKLEELT